MAYIGRQLARGENKLFDDISSSFNGSTTTFNLTVSSVATATATPYQLFVSLGGVMQKPNTDFTTAGNQITFTTAPAAGLSCWIMMQGDTIDQAAIPDASVTPSKISGSNFAFSGDLRLKDADGSHYVGFASPTTVASNKVWTLPAADGSASQYLQTNGSGVLTWATVSIGGATGIDFNDNVKARFGTGNDLEIFHNASNSVINDAGTGDLLLQVGGTTQATISSTGVVIANNLTVSGTTTTINTQTLDVEDKNIVVGKVSSPSDTTADGGGITLKGATDKTFNWVNATDAWTSSEHIHLIDNKKLFVGGASGTTDGLEVVHDGSNSILNDTGTGALKLQLGGSTKLEITSGGIDVTGAITVDGAALSTAPTITATASGAITIGQAVKINSDGSVSVIAGQSKSLGSLGTVTTMNAYPKGCYDSTNKRVFITYYDGDGNTYYSQIGTLSGTTVTWGTAVQHTTSTGGSLPKSPPFYDSAKDRFISFTAEGSNNRAKIRIWSASGTTLTLEGSLNSPENGNETPVMVNIPGTSRYGFFYKAQNSSNYLKGFVGELASDGNSITIGSATNLQTNSCEPHHGCWVTDKNFWFIPYTNWTHGGRMEARMVVDPGGTSTMSAGTMYEVNPHNQTNQRSNGAICIGGNQVIMNVYNTSNQAAFLAIWKPTSATAMGTQGTNYSLANAQQSGTLIHADLYDSTDGAMLYHVFQYGNDTSNNYVRLNKFRIGADNTFTLINDASDNSAENILESAGYGGFSVWHQDQKKLVSFTRDGDLHYQVNLRNASDIQDNGVVGFSSAGYSNGATATINVVGNTVTQSGLTPGKRYYVTNTGGVSQTASPLKTVRAGVALSATSLLIQTGGT